MTLPEVPDLVLFHAIATLIIEQSQTKRRRRRHVYFARDQIPTSATRHQGQNGDDADNQAEYGTNSFRIWMKFDQYRRHLMLSREYPFIVVTDITNFSTALHMCSSNMQCMNWDSPGASLDYYKYC